MQGSSKLSLISPAHGIPSKIWNPMKHLTQKVDCVCMINGHDKEIWTKLDKSQVKIETPTENRNSTHTDYSFKKYSRGRVFTSLNFILLRRATINLKTVKWISVIELCVIALLWIILGTTNKLKLKKKIKRKLNLQKLLESQHISMKPMHMLV